MARIPLYLPWDETERLFSAVDMWVETGPGVAAREFQDGLVLELIYGSGLRVSELCALNFESVEESAERSWELVINGEDRVAVRRVPVSQRAAMMLHAWLAVPSQAQHYDDEYLKARDSTALFVNEKGNRVTRTNLNRMWHRRLYELRLPYRGGLGILRATCAVHMLAGGAPVWAVAQMLGIPEEEAARYANLNLSVVGFEATRMEHRRFHPRG